jgi:hypothetical protein
VVEILTVGVPGSSLHERSSCFLLARSKAHCSPVRAMRGIGIEHRVFRQRDPLGSKLANW